MDNDLGTLSAFVAVARQRGFREAARATGMSASALSEAVRRLEASMGVRLLERSTRSVTPTEAGLRLLQRLEPALAEVATALDVVNDYRGQPRGTLRLNAPSAVTRTVLPPIIEPFLTAYPDIRLELTEQDSFVDVLAAGCDAGIRYEEKLERDMIAIPIGARRQRVLAAAAPDYLLRRGHPSHPRELLAHACIRVRFASGTLAPWQFERRGQQIVVDPEAQLVVSSTSGDTAISAAVAGLGVVYLFEEWLRPAMDRGALAPVLEDWWSGFSGPFLYYSGRRHMPGPLRAFVDFVKTRG